MREPQLGFPLSRAFAILKFARLGAGKQWFVLLFELFSVVVIALNKKGYC